LNILDKIIADKRIEVQRDKALVSLDDMKVQADEAGHCRDFFKAVTKPNQRGLNVIAEIKKASPSAGLIRTDFDPAEIAQIYESCGADAISVLTDEKYFQGRLEYIAQVKEAVSLPVLRKDFIIDEYQVYQARAAGADAILLIAEALKKTLLAELLTLANKLSLAVLVEVHSSDTLLTVKEIKDSHPQSRSVIGINNRDLTAMTVDINTTGKLAEQVEAKNQLVAESGIKSRADVEKLISIGVGAVLIGQTLCESEDIQAKFEELFGAKDQ